MEFGGSEIVLYRERLMMATATMATAAGAAALLYYMLQS
jgi:hypothetical protein